MPGGRLSARKPPRSSVTSVRVAPVSVLLTTTVTPGRTAFDSSVTTPEIVPVVACARAGSETARSARNRRPRIARICSRMYRNLPLVLPFAARRVYGFGRPVKDELAPARPGRGARYEEPDR